MSFFCILSSAFSENAQSLRILQNLFKNEQDRSKNSQDLRIFARCGRTDTLRFISERPWDVMCVFLGGGRKAAQFSKSCCCCCCYTLPWERRRRRKRRRRGRRRRACKLRVEVVWRAGTKPLNKNYCPGLYLKKKCGIKCSLITCSPFWHLNWELIEPESLSLKSGLTWQQGWRGRCRPVSTICPYPRPTRSAQNQTY